MASYALIDVLVKKNDELVDYINYRFGDRQFAQEVVQEACIRVLQIKPDTNEVQSPIALLKTICLRVAIDFYRKERSFTDHIDICDDLPDLIDVSMPKLTAPELLTAKQQRTEILFKAICLLPLNCRDVFILTQLYHYSQYEVAEQLNISRGMVARHLAKSLKIIQPILLADDE